MVFSQEDYSVTIEGEKIQLLRKEFQLLSFLYKNRGRAFTREELLDAVWSMEMPTDRTVDDHIYRLRKKLAAYSHYVMIKTVKGYGYLLEVMEQNEEETLPEEIVRQTEQLMSMYYQYGYGNYLKSLINNKKLGLSNMEKHEMILNLLKSDFPTLYEQVSRKKYTFLQLFLYVFVEDDTKTAINTCYKVLEKCSLDELNMMDIKYVLLPLLYMKNDDAKMALEFVKEGLNESTNDEKHRFFPLLKVLEGVVLFFQNEVQAAQVALNEAETALKKFPFRREQGALQVARGCILLAEGNEQRGLETIEEGRTLIQRTGHTYYFLFIYTILEILLPKATTNDKTIQYYKREKEAYYTKSRLFELKNKICAHMKCL